MVTQADIQAKINYGYGIAATILGEMCNVFAPADARNATTARAYVGTLPVRFDPNYQFMATKPQGYGHPVWGAAFDRTDTKVGWYLISPSSGTFFITAQQPLLPSSVVLCNRVINLTRPTDGPDQNGFAYGGQSANEGVIATQWPCSILAGPKGDRPDSDAMLPGSTRNPWAAVLLPSIPKVTIQLADVLTDDLGHRWTVSGSELTEFGWRLTADLSVE